MPNSTVTMARRLSELEAAVLGLVWSDGPCTAYAVRRTVQNSLSTQWSGSAGAVYPVVALRPPIDPDSLGIPPDPLRVRLRFLELLSPADRTTFLNEAIAAVETTVDRVQRDVRRARRAGESPFRIAMVLGALHATRARLRTLKELKASLAG
jgi:hypothetical protein